MGVVIRYDSMILGVLCQGFIPIELWIFFIDEFKVFEPFLCVVLLPGGVRPKMAQV